MNKPHEFDFCEHIGKQLAHIKEPRFLVLELLRTGVIKEKTVLQFMSVLEYDKQLKRTKTKRKKRGCKMMAVDFVCAKLPISSKTVCDNIKKRSERFNVSLFLPK